MKTLRQFQEQLPPPPSKAVVFMFGRFNTPTQGHEVMIESAIRVARKLGIQDVRLYASYSQDAKKNPILHEEKIKWLRKFFTGIEVVEDQTVRSPFDVARKLSEEGVKQVVMVAGSDRANEFQFRIGKYINHPDPEKTYTFEDFTVVSCGRDPDATDASGVSASKMREFAAAANFEGFVKGLPSLASDMDGKDLFEAIRRGMNLGERGVVVDERLSRINEDFESTTDALAQPRELLELRSFDKWWWNSRTGLLVEVKSDWHVQQVVNNPETFGLSKDDQKVLFPPDAHKKDVLPLLQARLLKKGWVEVTFARGLGELVIRSGTPKEAQKALNRFLKLIPDPNEVRIGSGRHAIRLVGSQSINIFARTGKEPRISPLSAFR